MPNNKELELERQALLLDMAGKIDVIFNLLTQATIASEAPVEEKKSERKTRKKAKKAE
jgi:hypothetical protein